jgi:hypothetical protein
MSRCKQLCVKPEFGLRHPAYFGLHHGIDDHQKLPHAGRNGDFKTFARCSESFIEAFDFGITPYGRHRTHV